MFEVWSGMVVAQGTITTFLPAADEAVSMLFSTIRRAGGSGLPRGLLLVTTAASLGTVDGSPSGADGASGHVLEWVFIGGTEYVSLNGADGASDIVMVGVSRSDADGASDIGVECVAITRLETGITGC
jgi:hypothetical protein